MFHKHKWTVESTYFTPPVQLKNMKGGDEEAYEFLQSLIQGTTHVYMRCQGCKDLKETRVNGHYVPRETK